jgi:cell division protein FtsI/penicillin-binding protein 2
MSSGKPLPMNPRRLLVLIGCLIFGVTVIVGRLVYYQVLRHEELRVEADQQRTWEKEQPPRRGYIADVNGHILALNVIEWDISVSPPLVFDRAELADRLSDLLGLPQAEVSATLTAKQPWLQLVTGVEYEVGEAIASLEAEGLTCLPRPERFYPESNLMAHVLGIVNSTGTGFYGVEGYYNQLLRGSDGQRRVEQNPGGREIPIAPLGEIPPQAGTNLILTLDRSVQYIAKQELERALETYGAESGTVVIMEPQTGAILASVSYPTYDPNAFAHAIRSCSPTRWSARCGSRVPSLRLSPGRPGWIRERSVRARLFTTRARWRSEVASFETGTGRDMAWLP